jgi:repressor LexA
MTAAMFAPRAVFMPTPDRDPRAVTLGRYIRAVRQKRGFNRPYVAREAWRLYKVEITPDYLSKLESGTRSLAKASPEIREALRAMYGISVEQWFSDTQLHTSETVKVNNLTADIASNRHEILPIESDENFIWVPVYSFVSASLDGTHGDDPAIVDYRRILRTRMQNGYTLFRVVGDSMSPTIRDGDDIRVDVHNTKPSDADVYLIAIPHGQVCVKRLRRLDGEWWMFSDNVDQKMFPPQRFPQNAVIRGFVVSRFPAEESISGGL